MKDKLLEVLDRIESMRIRALENPGHYSTDYCLRVAEGILSAEFGWHSRLEWTEELAQRPTSDLYKRTHA